MADVEAAVKALVWYGVDKGLITRNEVTYAANSIFDVLAYEPASSFRALSTQDGSASLEELLKILLDDAAGRGLIDGGIASRDLLDTKIMGCLTPRPGEVIRTFNALAGEDPRKATDYFYKLSLDSDYIRSYRIRKDRKWVAHTSYGELDITINLSKPEKDPKAIAAALSQKQSKYPKCLLCPENEGYHGRLDHPARQTLRLIPVTLGGEEWYFQYSPYVYYNEHCIVLSGEHRPMKIDHATFVRLFDFLKLFPHYTVGSNADLPIVGGSILTHEHFQGGRYDFAMAKAPVRELIAFPGFEDVGAGIVEWPMSVLRLTSPDPERIIALCDRILAAWRTYSDPESQIYAYSDENGSPSATWTEGAAVHNTITPIARMRGEFFEMDLVLRNNRTTKQYPLGIFHPHAELHHIKKENIGLIEVMGLAVLPARLLGEMEEIRRALVEGGNFHEIPSLAPHAEWMEEIRMAHPELNAGNAGDILKEEIGIAFMKVLEHCGVFKDTEEGQAAFWEFLEAVK